MGIPDAPWIREAERNGGFPDSPREEDSTIIAWKHCDECNDMTLHRFEGEVGECMKCDKR